MTTEPTEPKRSPFEVARLYRLARKELVEILRDRRTIITLVLMPLLVYPLMGIVVQKLILQSLTESPQTVYNLAFESEAQAIEFKHLLVIGERAIRADRAARKKQVIPVKDEVSETERLQGQLRESLRQSDDIELNYFFTDGYALEKLVQRKVDLGVAYDVGPSGKFSFRLVYDPESSFSMRAMRYVQKRLRFTNEVLIDQIVATSGTRLPQPVAMREVPVEASGNPQPILLTFVPLMLVLMTITGAVYPAIDLTAGERERGTMEILVAAPVSRLLILVGKFVAVLAVALLTAVANLIAMTVTVYALGLDKLIFGEAVFSLSTLFVIFILLFVLAAFFSATLLCLTSFARSFKEAQAYLIPLMLVAFAPGLLSLTPSLQTSTMLSVVPLVNIVLSGRDLLAGQSNSLFVTISILSTAIYGLMALSLAARIFGMDSILTGGKSSWSDLWSATKESKYVPDFQASMLLLAILFPAFVVFAGLSSNLAGKLGFSITGRLVVNAIVTVLLFLVLPYLFAVIAKFRIATTFFLIRPSNVALFAGCLLGGSAWVLVYELEILTLTDNRIDQFVEIFESMKVELGRIPLPIKLVCLAFVPALCEEFTFRGFLLSSFRNRIPDAIAVMVTAVLFGLFHVFVRDALMFERLLPSTCMGLLLGWVCIRTGSIVPGMLLHGIHNGLLISLSHYEKQLVERGLGMSNQQHLPQSWIIIAVVLMIVGMVVIVSARRAEIQTDHLAD